MRARPAALLAAATAAVAGLVVRRRGKTDPEPISEVDAYPTAPVVERPIPLSETTTPDESATGEAATTDEPTPPTT